jgi:hypothetical protein
VKEYRKLAISTCPKCKDTGKMRNAGGYAGYCSCDIGNLVHCVETGHNSRLHQDLSMDERVACALALAECGIDVNSLDIPSVINGRRLRDEIREKVGNGIS